MLAQTDLKACHLRDGRLMTQGRQVTVAGQPK